MTPLCACGKPAELIADVQRTDAMLSREPLCSIRCPTVLAPGTVLDVLVERGELAAISRSHTCWCHLRMPLGGARMVVSWCPAHGCSR